MLALCCGVVWCSRGAGEAVDMAGICQLGEDIGVDAATDVSILVLCWKLGAKVKPGHVMEAEWMEGMERLGADSTDKVQGQEWGDWGDGGKGASCFDRISYVLGSFGEQKVALSFCHGVAADVSALYVKKHRRYVSCTYTFISRPLSAPLS